MARRYLAAVLGHLAGVLPALVISPAPGVSLHLRIAQQLAVKVGQRLIFHGLALSGADFVQLSINHLHILATLRLEAAGGAGVLGGDMAAGAAWLCDRLFLVTLSAVEVALALAVVQYGRQVVVRQPIAQAVAGVVDDDAVVFPRSDAQATAHHLVVKHQRFGGAGEHNAGGFGSVESLGQHRDIAQHLDITTTVRVDYLGAQGGVALIAIDVGGLDAAQQERITQGAAVSHVGTEHDSLATLGQLEPLVNHIADQRGVAHHLGQRILGPVAIRSGLDALEVRHMGCVAGGGAQVTAANQVGGSGAHHEVVEVLAEPLAERGRGQADNGNAPRLALSDDLLMLAVQNVALVNDDYRWLERVGDLVPTVAQRLDSGHLHRLAVVRHGVVALDDADTHAILHEPPGGLVHEFEGVHDEKRPIALGDGALLDGAGDGGLASTSGEHQNLRLHACLDAPTEGVERVLLVRSEFLHYNLSCNFGCLEARFLVVRRSGLLPFTDESRCRLSWISR